VLGCVVVAPVWGCAAVVSQVCVEVVGGGLFALVVIVRWVVLSC
jgi:hypothetical protein